MKQLQISMLQLDSHYMTWEDSSDVGACHAGPVRAAICFAIASRRQAGSINPAGFTPAVHPADHTQLCLPEKGLEDKLNPPVACLCRKARSETRLAGMWLWGSSSITLPVQTASPCLLSVATGPATLLTPVMLLAVRDSEVRPGRHDPCNIITQAPFRSLHSLNWQEKLIIPVESWQNCH